MARRKSIEDINRQYARIANLSGKSVGTYSRRLSGAQRTIDSVNANGGFKGRPYTGYIAAMRGQSAPYGAEIGGARHRLQETYGDGNGITSISEGGIKGKNMKQRDKDYARSMLATASFQNERDDEDEATRSKRAHYYLQNARKNGATTKMAKHIGGFTNAQLKAAGYTIG